MEHRLHTLFPEFRSCRFCEGRVIYGVTAPSSGPSAAPTALAESVDNGEITSLDDIKKAFEERTEGAREAIAALDKRIAQYQNDLNVLKAGESGGDSKSNVQSQNAQSQEGQSQEGAPPDRKDAVDWASLLKKHGYEINPSAQDKISVLQKEIAEATTERDAKAGEVRAEEQERCRQEDEYVANLPAGSAEGIGVRFSQLMRSKSADEFFGNLGKIYGEYVNFKAYWKGKVENAIKGIVDNGSNAPSKRKDPLIEEVKKIGADKVKENALASKNAAQKELDDPTTGLKKVKNDLNEAKTGLGTTITDLENEIRDMDDGPGKQEKVRDLQGARSELRKVDEDLVQVDKKIANQEAKVTSADAKIAAVDKLVEGTTAAAQKLQEANDAARVTIDGSGAKNMDEGKTMLALLKGTSYSAEGMDILIKDTDDKELAAAREAVGKLGLDASALDTISKDGQLIIKNPSAFSEVLKSCTQQLVQKNAMATLKLLKSPDGSGYIREGYQGRYFLQKDGSIYFAGGKKGGKAMAPSTYVNDSWDPSRDRPLPETESEIAKGRESVNAANSEVIAKLAKELSLVAASEGGTFIREGYTGKYKSQSDGTIFYEGGKGPSGSTISPRTYLGDNKWDDKRNKPLTA